MKYTFVCSECAGSTYLYTRLRRRWRVRLRPDKFLFPDYYPCLKKTSGKYAHIQYLDSSGHDVLPASWLIAGFQRRSGYSFNPEHMIADNLRSYYLWQRDNPRVVTLFSRAPTLGFFTRIRDVLTPGELIFVVRHPLHQYLTFVKPHKNFEFVDGYGGADTEGGVRFFAEDWNRYIEDALGSGAAIVRFEFVHEDALKLDDVPRGIFAKWDSSRRNACSLSPRNLEWFRAAVARNYQRVYGDKPWEI